MNLGINKDEACIIHCALEYFAKQGGLKDCMECFPNSDMKNVLQQLIIIEEIGEEKL